MRHTGVVLILAAWSRAAFAQVPPDVVEPQPDAVHGPGFVTIDRQDANSRVGVEASYSYFDLGSGARGSLTPLRFEGYGQYVDAASGAGGYASLPISYYNISPDTGPSESATGLGDLEVGGIFVPKASSNGLMVVLHGGITLPTGSSAKTTGGSTGDGAIANILVAESRLNDIYQTLPRGVSLRLGISPVYRSGQLFARADLCLDANLSNEGSKNADSFIRMNLAAGIDLDQVALSAEVTNLYDSSANGRDFGSSWIDTGAVAARFMAGNVQPYAAVIFPLDHESHEGLVGKFDLALTVGAAALLK